VAGVRTPKPVAQLAKIMPEAAKELEKVRQTLESHFRDVQDFEFTIEEGKVFMLQTRNGKRTGLAAVRFAVEMEKEKLITWQEAVQRVPAEQLDQVLAPVFDRAAVKSAKTIAKGLPAGPGAATGRIYFNADRAVEAAHKGEKVLLVRVETSPEDLRGMIAAEGILTARGGVSSHAALVARQMGKVCVCGASELHVDYAARTMEVGGQTFKESDFLSIDGTAGEVYAGELKTAPSEIIQVLVGKTLEAKESRTYQNFAQLMKWCGKATRMNVRTNADSPEQVANAMAFGAVGIGLCRTEHMFFEGNRIDAMREMILADNLEDRKKALAKLLPYQRDDFIGIFRTLKGLPATIRTLDPPLHEFLPHEEAAQKDLAAKMGVPVEKITKRVEALHEFNPMLGLRGCRLGIVFPEITEMQTRAIIEAAAQVQKEGIPVKPEIMIVLVGFPKELQLQLEVVHKTAKLVQEEKKTKVKYLVGTMIEIPRGALVADEIAKDAQFFSFGTNDLTQTCLGMSRDDSGHFLPRYQELEIVKQNPFATIDQSGVGALVQIDLRRTRGRPRQREILSSHRIDLCELLTFPRAHRPPGRRASRPGGKAQGQVEEEVIEKIATFEAGRYSDFKRVDCLNERKMLYVPCRDYPALAAGNRGNLQIANISRCEALRASRRFVFRCITSKFARGGLVKIQHPLAKILEYKVVLPGQGALPLAFRQTLQAEPNFGQSNGC
jgi:pyruvate,orthophosphate dikinase